MLIIAYDGSRLTLKERVQLKTRLTETKTNYILDAINALVIASRLPAVHSAIVESKVAKASELRKLENKGLIKACWVRTDDGTMKAYYTEGAVPDAIKHRLDKPDQSTASEVDHESGCESRS